MFKYVAGALALACVWFYIQLQWSQMEVLELEGTVQRVEIERDVAKANVISAEEKNDVQASQIEGFIEKIAVIEKERDENRERLQYVEGLFEDDRFQRLLGSNPSLISLRMKKATAKVLQELDDATK
jgi:hypothetical protein